MECSGNVLLEVEKNRSTSKSAIMFSILKSYLFEDQAMVLKRELQVVVKELRDVEKLSDSQLIENTALKQQLASMTGSYEEKVGSLRDANSALLSLEGQLTQMRYENGVLKTEIRAHQLRNNALVEENRLEKVGNRAFHSLKRKIKSEFENFDKKIKN